MNIDWVHFYALQCGNWVLMMIAAAAILLLFNGRIAGISSIF